MARVLYVYICPWSCATEKIEKHKKDTKMYLCINVRKKSWTTEEKDKHEKIKNKYLISANFAPPLVKKRDIWL